ncbi:3'-5' exonuclease [Aestuariicella hydrocarbonica]|uniref:3'-5' exonuclease n=1 Tax=Pseudomaricurvus hydrocarbonicus TaxID=1470433 RepID=A0A9E5T2K4_9GAMM|nr:3'-5' exonuclease [Aestuariicella hydrocarbonica]NHO68505.1 3'-5' exonuclease [Aestuariicella hydrocarbonica]
MFVSRPQQSVIDEWQRYHEKQASVCTHPVLQRFYQTPLLAADTPLSRVSFVALDFETTGLDPRRNEIVSIGIVPFTLQGIFPAEGYYQVVKPTRTLTEESIAFHRITHSQVDAAPPLEKVLNELVEQLRGRMVVVHYREIERPFLDLACRQLWRERCLFPLIDTMAIEARWERRGWKQSLKQLFGGQPVSIRLNDSRQRYGLPVYSSHHAKVDAMATAELFSAQVARHYDPTTPIGQLWD